MRNHSTWVIWYICVWRVTAQWLLTSDPLTERATSNYPQTRCLCEDLKIVGKTGKRGTRLGLQDDFQNKLLIWPARRGPLCLLLLHQERVCISSPLIELWTWRTYQLCSNETVRKTLPPWEQPLSTHTAGNWTLKHCCGKGPASINLFANSNNRSIRKNSPSLTSTFQTSNTCI